MRIGRTIERLDEMLERGIAGTFEEADYDETKLSRLEAKWKRFLADSSIARESLERDKAEIKSMVSDISHQTKTPVANMKLYSELLKESLGKESGNRREELRLAEEIYRQAEKLEFLMSALTKMSRLETGMVSVKPKPAPLEPLLEQAAAQILPGAQKKGIAVVWEREAVRGKSAVYDLKWTAEALANLGDNAVKYSGEGSKIRFFVKPYVMYTAICVEDQGRGIPEEEIPKIFGRFYRGSAVSQEEGVGIGLYLAREIVRRQKGYIKVTSKVGAGSVFSVYLPNVQGEEKNLSEVLDF